MEGYKITIFFSGLIGTHLTERTDDDGWASFEIENTDKLEQETDYVYVELSSFPTIITKTLTDCDTISDGETMSFSISDDDWYN